jgi:hypothetical protein
MQALEALKRAEDIWTEPGRQWETECLLAKAQVLATLASVHDRYSTVAIHEMLRV